MTEEVHDEPPSDDDEVAAAIDELHVPLTDEPDLDEEIEPAPEPDAEVADDHHQVPLESDDDARYLDPVDPRRREVEARRGRPFTDDEEQP